MSGEAHIRQNSFGEFVAPEYKNYIKPVSFDLGDDEFYESDLSGPFANSSAFLSQAPILGHDSTSPGSIIGSNYRNTTLQISEKNAKECQQFIKNSTKKPSIMGIKTPEDSVVEKEGWVQKEGKFLSKSWKKRWLILTSDSLSYYLTNQCKGIVILEGCVCHLCKTRADVQNCIEIVVKPPKQDKTSGTGDFQFQAAQNLVNGKTLYFKSDTLQEAKNWMIAINQQISKVVYKKKVFSQHMGLDDRVLEFLSNPEQECLDLTNMGNFFSEASAEQNLYVDLAKQQIFMQTSTNLPQTSALNVTATQTENLKENLDTSTNTNTETNSEIVNENENENEKGTEHENDTEIENPKMSDSAKSSPSKNKSQSKKQAKSITRAFTNFALSSLENTLKCHECLKELVLRNCDIGDDGLKILASVLRDNNSIQHIDFSENLLSDNAMSQFLISAGLKNNASLKYLDLSKNMLGDESMSIFSHILSSKRLPLKHLILNKNHITDNGAKKLFDGLKKNTSVEILELECNQLSEDSFSSQNSQISLISEVLKSNTCCLQQILFGHNLIGNLGAKVLADALTTNKSLKILGIEFNNIQFDGISQLFSMLDKNDNLQELRIGGNCLTEKSISAVMDGLKNGLFVSEIEIKSCKD